MCNTEFYILLQQAAFVLKIVNISSLLDIIASCCSCCILRAVSDSMVEVLHILSV